MNKTLPDKTTTIKWDESKRDQALQRKEDKAQARKDSLVNPRRK